MPQESYMHTMGHGMIRINYAMFPGHVALLVPLYHFLASFRMYLERVVLLHVPKTQVTLLFIAFPILHSI